MNGQQTPDSDWLIFLLLGL